MGVVSNPCWDWKSINMFTTDTDLHTDNMILILIVTCWCSNALRFWSIQDSCNCLLPNSTQQLSEPMSTYFFTRTRHTSQFPGTVRWIIFIHNCCSNNNNRFVRQQRIQKFFFSAWILNSECPNLNLSVPYMKPHIDNLIISGLLLTENLMAPQFLVVLKQTCFHEFAWAWGIQQLNFPVQFLWRIIQWTLHTHDAPTPSMCNVH